MRRMHCWIPGVLLVAAAAGCGSGGDSPDAPGDAADESDATPGPTVTIETFNVGLAGAFIPYEVERRAAVVEAVAAMTSDVVCLQEVWRQEDKAAVEAAAGTTFPWTASFAHDLDTAVAPVDSDCTVPPEPTAPPCTGATVLARLDDAIACLRENCSTVPGSDDGRMTTAACAEESCIGAAATLMLAGDEGLACYGCLAPNLPTETFAGMREVCTTNPRGGLAFRGQSGVMILSRHPLSNVEALVLPGTWNRRAIVRATVSLPEGGDVDVYCNHLTAVFGGTAYPYTGRWGCGRVDERGWEHEQRLQAQALLDYVAASTGSGRAVVLGDFNAGPEYSDGGAVVVRAEAVQTHELLLSRLTEAAPAGYVPACTSCPDNELTDGDDPVWIDHVFLSGIPASAARSLERTFTAATVAVAPSGDAGTPTTVHPSDHYGLRAVVEFAP